MNNQQRIKIITSYQNNPIVHPLTCGVNSMHENLIPIEENGEVILICLDCNYIQSLDDEFIELLERFDEYQREALKQYKEIVDKYKH